MTIAIITTAPMIIVKKFTVFELAADWGEADGLLEAEDTLDEREEATELVVKIVGGSTAVVGKMLVVAGTDDETSVEAGREAVSVKLSVEVSVGTSVAETSVAVSVEVSVEVSVVAASVTVSVGPKFYQKFIR